MTRAPMPDCTCPPMGTCPRHGIAKPDKPVRQRAPMSTLPRSSESQDVRQAFLAGIKAERIAHALLTKGYVECARCPERFKGSLSAFGDLDLAHVDVARSAGTGYRPGEPGVDHPNNLELMCRPCHEAFDRLVPEWTEATP